MSRSGEKALREATSALAEAGVAYALIGGLAMAAHGAPRATQDLDLLAGARCLEPTLWASARSRRVRVDIRTGDDDDPLLGLVAISPRSPMPVELVVLRGGWVHGVLTRARAAGAVFQVGGCEVPVVSASDLVLLKLYAGGPMDQADIHTLLSLPTGSRTREEVDALIVGMPRDVQALWTRLQG